MKRQKALFTTVFTLIFALLFLAACSSGASNEAGSDKGSSKDGGDRIEKIKEAGKIRVITYPDVTGWSVMDANGDFEGYDPDIARRLAEKLGVEVEFVPTDGVNRIPLLETDRADVAIAIFSVTDERKEKIDFTIPYASAGVIPIFRKDNPISSWEELLTKTVSVPRGAVSDNVITEESPDTDIKRFDSITDAFMAAKTGKVDAFVTDETNIYLLAKEHDDMEAFSGEPHNPLPIAMGVKKGEDAWLEYLNEFIEEYNASGDNADSYMKWFGGKLNLIEG